MPGVRAISRRPKMKKKQCQKCVHRKVRVRAQQGLRLWNNKASDYGTARPEFTELHGQRLRTTRPEVTEQQGQRLRNSKARGYRTARPLVTEQQVHRLQNSKARGYRTAKPEVTEQQGHW
jgi:hypothetical protein